MPISVCVTIVTHNSRQYIDACLQSAFAQTFRPRKIVVVDNASTDGTQEILAKYACRIEAIRNRRNVGFAAAQNQAIAATVSRWALVLNPDAALRPDFIDELVEYAQMDPRIGTVCGRLLSCDRDLRPLDPPLLDSTGIYFTPAMRHFDRGWHEPDDGRYGEVEYVFGASAAAAMYRVAFLRDVAIDGEALDEDFFAYREDADLAWRGQLRGWRAMCEPRAVGYHVRRVTPQARRRLPADVNLHSVKNRFLLRIKNMTPDLYRKNWLSITARDVVVVGACLLHEHSSLKAFVYLARNWRRVWAKRQEIMRRRKVKDDYLSSWFSYEPVSRPASRPTARGLAKTRAARG